MYVSGGEFKNGSGDVESYRCEDDGVVVKL